jgi:tetratricopeptide (TPR) repeat protein
MAPAEVPLASGAKFVPPVEGESAALVITGAGWSSANGVYTPTGKVLNGAPVFENDQKCLLSRESHQGKVLWILGQDQKPLYAVQAPAQSLTPPTTGWRKFGGALPLPRIQAMGSTAKAALAMATAWKEEGKDLFAVRQYEDAETLWTRALGLDGLTDETILVALYSNRAEVRLRRSKWLLALTDTDAVLRMQPGHEKAMLRASVALRELKKYDMARYLVQQCLDADPRHAEAKQLLADLDALMKEEGEEEAVTSPIPRVQEWNGKKGLKAFMGYSDAKRTAEAPLSSLPYHFLGLPKNEVDMMDAYFQEMRDIRDENALIEKENKEMYKNIRKEFLSSAKEGIFLGKLAPEEEFLPSSQSKVTEEVAPEVKRKPAETLFEAEPLQLSKQDVNDLDGFFNTFEPKESTEGTSAKPSGRKDRLARAKAVISGGRKAI